jgi:ABC-type antimicrobial peptide transport system permease subunit
MDPEVVPRFRAFQQIFAAAVATRRFNLMLLAVFAGTALLLAAAGIYGVMAYWVERRTQEIGIRMALGAERRDVLRLVAGQGLALAVIGITTGIMGAFWLTRFMASLLYEILPTDPASLAGASVLLLMVALLANIIPARRAANVDPVVALRCE